MRICCSLNFLFKLAKISLIFKFPNSNFKNCSTPASDKMPMASSETAYPVKANSFFLFSVFSSISVSSSLLNFSTKHVTSSQTMRRDNLMPSFQKSWSLLQDAVWKPIKRDSKVTSWIATESEQSQSSTISTSMIINTSTPAPSNSTGKVMIKVEHSTGTPA